MTRVIVGVATFAVIAGACAPEPDPGTAPASGLPQTGVDYRRPRGGAERSALTLQPTDGARVSYVTFDGIPFQLREFTGRFTSLLVSQAVLDQVGLPRLMT